MGKRSSNLNNQQLIPQSVYDHYDDIPEFGMPPGPFPRQKTLREQRAELDMKIQSSNQNLARKLVLWLMIALGVVFLVSLVVPLIPWFNRAESLAAIGDKLLPIFQSVLFTLLGYLFGEKAAQSKE